MHWLKRAAFIAGLLLPTMASAVDVQIASFTDSPDPAPRGGQISYTITASNSDADTANNVVVTFALPTNTSFVSVVDAAVPGACAHDGGSPGVITCTYPTLLGTLAAPAAGPVRTITAVLRTTAATGNTVSSAVSITTTDVDVQPANNTLTQNTTINDGADLTAVMAGAPNPATGGGLVTWTISGSNLGPNTSGVVTFTTTLPGVLTYVSASGTGWSCTPSGQNITCTRAAVTVGAYADLAISTRITGVSGGTITLNGNMTSTVGDPDGSNHSPVASVSVDPGTDLAITQDPPTPNPAISAGTATFVLRPSNNGPYPASAGAQVSFPLPAGFTVNTVTASPGWSCTSAGSPVTVSCVFGGSLASGASGTLTIVTAVPTVVTTTTYSGITASIAPNAGGPVDPVASNNSASRSLNVLPDGVDLSISKSKSPALVALGANMVSSIVVSNAGPQTAASGTITVVDVLDPAKEQFVSFSGSNWSCVSAPPIVTCTYNAALGLASSSTLSITTLALSAGSATNNVNVAYSGTPGDYNPANDNASASVTITADINSPDLLVGVSAATAGGTLNRVEFDETRITYTATLTNKVIATAANAQNVVYTLSIPGRLSSSTVTVTGIVLTNTSGTSNATFTCAGAGSGSTGGITCTQAAGTQLSPGDVVTFTVTADRPLADGTFSGGQGVNAGVIVTAFSSSQGDPVRDDNVADATVIIDPIADVEVVSKVLAANTVLAGTNATYTVTLRNNGPSAAAGVSLADVFTIPGGDSGFTFVSASASNAGTCVGLTANTSYAVGTPTVTCSWAASVASGSTRTVTVVVRPNWQTGAAARTLGNVATVSTTTPEDSVGGQGAASNNKSLILNINPAQVDVLINNTDVPDPLGYDSGTPVNNDITYVVVTTNNGPSLASGTGFTYTMTPPAGKTITFRGDGSAANVAAVNPVGNIPGSLCDQLGNSVTGPATLTIACAHPAPAQLFNATSVTRHLVFRVGTAPNTGGDVYNTNSTVVINEADTNAANDNESEGTTVRVRADLSVTKTASINPVQLRQPFDWSIVVTNAGPGDSQTTGLTDTLPAGMVFGASLPTWALSSGPTGTCSVIGQSLTCAFGLVPAGQSVTVAIPGVRMSTYPAGGTTQNCASATTSEVDPNNVNNLTVCSSLTVQRSSLAGTVFEDRDRVGANAGTPQDAAFEPRIASVTIALNGTDAYGNVVSSTTTSDGAGAYIFRDLSPAGAGGYTLTQTQPAGFANGPANPPAPAVGGSYAAGGAGSSVWSGIALPGNTTGAGYDYPEVRRPSLSGYVYRDDNQNGSRDAGVDTPIANATVELLDGAGTVLQTTTTNASGLYQFTALDPLVVYSVREPLPAIPAGLVNGPVNPGLINGVACSAGCTAVPAGNATGADRINNIDLSAGLDGTLFNFGELQTGFISGLVWLDRDRDTLLDGAETVRLAGVTLRLVQGADCATGTLRQTTTTAADGSYRFDNVPAFQDYLICETQPAGYGTGSANGVPGNVAAVNNLAAAGSPNNNFGETLGSLAGSVYQDTGNGVPAQFNNGAREPGEAGIAGVPVTLSGVDIFGAAVNLNTTTDASGNYSFDDLLPPNAAGYALTEGAIPANAGTFLDGREAAGDAGGSLAVNDSIRGIALTAGQQASGYLFGELPIATITGTVYIDRDRNNTLGAIPTDGRIPGVTIRLVQGADCASGTLRQTTVTDPSGAYSFANLGVGGDYLLCQTQPAGYANGAENPGVAASTPGANVIRINNLPAAGSTGNHFGERAGSLAGSVYADHSPATAANTDNGVRDAGETGIAGVSVVLTGTDIAGNPVSRSTTTDADGNYRFDDLLQSGAGGYTLSEGAIPPAAGVFNDGRDTAGSAGGSNAVNDVLSGVSLGAGVQASGYNFGELPIAPISGRVYIDRDRNGSLGGGDSGIGGVTIRLVLGSNCSGTVVATTTTDASGNYSFNLVSAGLTYTLCQTQPLGYADGSTNPGGSGSSGAPGAITLSNLPGAGSAGNHFGEWTGSLTGSVYADHSPATPANTDNGVRDAGETGIAGVSVVLTGTDIAGNPVSRSTTTDAGGNYRFDDLLQSGAGGYTLSEGAIPQAAGVFNDGRDTAGSAGGSNVVNDVLSGVSLGAGVQASGYNFGELPIAPISGRVYIDRDRNGSLGGGDSGIGGVTIRLVLGSNCSGTVVATTTTDASGNYSFNLVSAGLTYTLCQTQPLGYADGSTNPGGSGSSSAAGAITLSNLPSAGSAGNHFGERVGSLAGAVYLDSNNDGLRQGGETGLAGVTVTLSGTDLAGSAITRTTTTDANGNYRFADLLAAGPAGYTVTEQAAQPVVGGVTTLNGRTTAGTIAGASAGTATAVGSMPSAVSAIPLVAGADSINNNFGELLPVAISGKVFIDLNNNGLQNLPSDAGLPGVPLVISGVDDTGATITRSIATAGDGSYAVNDLRPGTYTVTEPTQPTGTSNGATVVGSAGGTATPVLTLPSSVTGIVLATSGATSTGNNFAEIPSNSVLSGRVWLDTNNNSVIDGAEVGIAGVTIELSGTDTAGRPVARTTTTAADGSYSFDQLAPGTYTLREPVQPAGTVNGATVPGSSGGTATSPATAPSTLSAITLGVGATATGNNFGEVPAGEIGGRVYADNNNSGMPDADETGLAGVTLQLTGTDELGNPVSLTTSTAADGSYSFSNLRPGTYTVTQPTQPAGTINGQTTAGSLGGSATAPSVAISAIGNIVLPPGGKSINNNFGELANSPDLRVSKRMVGSRFTVGFPGSYEISVRNVGQIASNGAYTVSDRLPTGLTLASTPSGTGWVCVGAAGASSFSCTSSAAIAAGAYAAGVITASVNVAAAAAAATPVNNVVMVEGGGEIPVRGPSSAERDAFNNSPAALPVCTPAVEHEACRTPTAVQLAASISGTVWYDIGGATKLLDSGDRRLAGWQVEIVNPATGTTVGRASTGTDGKYVVRDLLAGVPLAVRFRDPASGIVFGYPVNGETAPGSSGASCNASGAATAGTASSCAAIGADPSLNVVLAPGQELQQQSLPVDPSGVVYDSGLRQPVPGSVVTLAPVGTCTGWNPATGLVGANLGGYAIDAGSVAMTVGADGFYQYLFAPTAPASCTFGLTVAPPSGHIFQSAVIPPTAGPLVPSGGAGSTFLVQPQATAPAAAVGTGTTYYLTFNGGSGGANIIHNHLPVDPALPGAIALSKTGDKAVAEVGDSIRYAITVTVASGALPRQTTVVDRLPAGFTYIRGTAMVGDRPIADPQGGVGPTLAFHLGAMPASKQLVLHYRIRVGVGAQQGDGINRAKGHACGVPTGCVDADFVPLGGAVGTNESAYRVRISGGVFTTDACVLGKVYVDCNGNQRQDAEELGVPGVRLVMQDGTTLVSDSEGKYSQCGLPPRSAVLRIDPLTLPRGSRLVTSSNRNLGDAGSLWLDLKHGELHRADFIEGSCSNTVLEQVKARRAQGEVRAPETEKSGGPALRFDSKAHGKTPLSAPQQGTDGANQRLPKPRAPLPPPAGAATDETAVPTHDLPMNRPAPVGRDSAAANDAGAQNGTR
jgi:uncharacterized repeat protein (TIGR01451 family)